MGKVGAVIAIGVFCWVTFLASIISMAAGSARAFDDHFKIDIPVSNFERLESALPTYKLGYYLGEPAK